jgi:hypothetical protein
MSEAGGGGVQEQSPMSEAGGGGVQEQSHRRRRSAGGGGGVQEQSPMSEANKLNPENLRPKPQTRNLIPKPETPSSLQYLCVCRVHHQGRGQQAVAQSRSSSSAR